MSAMTAVSSRFGVFDLYMAAALGKADLVPCEGVRVGWSSADYLKLTGYSPVSGLRCVPSG